MKRRIAVIAECFPPRLGADRRIFELMKRLSKKYDIHFITLPPSYALFIRKIDSYDNQKRKVVCEEMSGHRLSLPKPISRFWTKSFLIAFVVTEVYLCLQMLKKMAQLKPSENSEISIQRRQNSRKAVCQKYDFDHLATVFDQVIESGL